MKDLRSALQLRWKKDLDHQNSDLSLDSTPDSESQLYLGPNLTRPGGSGRSGLRLGSRYKLKTRSGPAREKTGWKEIAPDKETSTMGRGTTWTAGGSRREASPSESTDSESSIFPSTRRFSMTSGTGIRTKACRPQSTLPPRRLLETAGGMPLPMVERGGCQGYSCEYP